MIIPLATNECAQGRHNCHQNAQCIDLQEGFDCKCSSGFTGDGIRDCTGILRILLNRALTKIVGILYYENIGISK